jgi:hypothetical protein
MMMSVMTIFERLTAQLYGNSAGNSSFFYLIIAFLQSTQDT